MWICLRRCPACGEREAEYSELYFEVQLFFVLGDIITEMFIKIGYTEIIKEERSLQNGCY